MSKIKGNRGESLACDYLVREGYKILERNFKGPRGEVDIIVMKEEVLVFVEVKTFSFSGIEALEWAINKKKQQKIIGVVPYFLLKFAQFSEFFIRFDVILVADDFSAPVHLENAFTEFGIS